MLGSKKHTCKYSNNNLWKIDEKNVRDETEYKNIREIVKDTISSLAGRNSYGSQYGYQCCENTNDNKCANRQKQTNQTKKQVCYDADYIIIGMGAAGCVVARVLSEQSNFSVIGIEAGANQICEEPIRNVLYNGLLEEEYAANYFWQHDATHLAEGEEFELQTGCTNITTGTNVTAGNNRAVYSSREIKNANTKTSNYVGRGNTSKINTSKINKEGEITVQHDDGGHDDDDGEMEMETPHAHNYTTGRIFGGGSSINGLQYVRPTPSIFNYWAQITRNRIWDPARMTQYFIEIERYNGTTQNPSTRGYNGLLNIRQAPANPTDIANTIVEATSSALGIPTILDYNDPTNGVVGVFSRWQLFEQPNRQRESSATAFLDENFIQMVDNNVAIGTNRKLKIFFNTLAKKLIWDDHGKKIVGVEIIKDGNSTTIYANKAVILCSGINNTQLLQLSGIGPADILQRRGINVVVENSNVGKNLTNHPVVPIVFSAPEGMLVPEDDPESLYGPGAFTHNPLYNLPRGFQWIWSQSAEGQLVLILLLLNPLSRGIDRIQSNDPLRITLTYEPQLADPNDLQSYVNLIQNDILKVADRLNAIDPMYDIITPSREVIANTEELENYILSTVDHTHHQGQTNRMADSPVNGVVDGVGKVFGVDNLYIADDSIFPHIPDGNTTASAIIIGYTIAKELLKN